MRHIFRAMEGHRPGIIRTPARSEEYNLLDMGLLNASRAPTPSPRPATNSRSQSQKDTLYSLPPANVCRGLIERYFSNTGLLFPYIHKESFNESYEKLEAGKFRQARRTWLGVLNMILAMASTTAVHENNIKGAKQRMQESEVFYQRALGICQSQMLRGTSLETGWCSAAWIPYSD